MNNKFLSLAAAAATMLAFAACNKDDQKLDVITADMATAYAKVAISMPSVTGTRAETFESGTDDESYIDDVTLVFYDAAGTYVGKGEMVSEAYIPSDQTNDNIDKKGKHTHVFKLSLQEGANKPTQVVAFINTTSVSTANLQNLTGGVEYKGDLHNNETEFVMTNSGYYDENGEYVVAADVTGEFYTSQSDAEAANAQTNAIIYVERLAAKITTKLGGTVDAINQPSYKVINTKGEEMKLVFTPTKWAPTGKANTEWLVKTPFEYNEEVWKNDANRFRSYWAEGVNYTKNYNDYYENKDVTGLLTFVKFEDVNELGSVGETAQYVREHTTKLNITEDHAENLIANTYALVIGNYAVHKKSGEDFVPSTSYKDVAGNTDFYLLLTGDKEYTIFTSYELIAYLLRYNQISKVYSDSDATIEIPEEDLSSYFDLEYNNEGQYILIVKKDSYTAKDTKISLVNQKATKSRHYNYANGAAYFNVPILHNSGDEEIYGVVRNHSYVLNIKSITSLGAPLNGDVFDSPDDPIIPDPDELKDHFIKAEINVLSWHAINNDVTL